VLTRDMMPVFWNLVAPYRVAVSTENHAVIRNEVDRVGLSTRFAPRVRREESGAADALRIERALHLLRIEAAPSGVDFALHAANLATSERRL
jgi:hypothetical protein